MPETGQIAIFDRSWYGRVLVERVEGFCKEADWKRAYSEINQFERQFMDFGGVILKFWLQIDQAEQLRRFKEREKINYKSWKITDEDWRNRGKWEDYEVAVEEMLLKTSTQGAPWTVVEANDKYYARVKVLKTVVAKLKAELH
jgi:polyphosphate kinase 2 (PPK2 family)